MVIASLPGVGSEVPECKVIRVRILGFQFRHRRAAVVFRSHLCGSTPSGQSRRERCLWGGGRTPRPPPHFFSLLSVRRRFGAVGPLPEGGPLPAEGGTAQGHPSGGAALPPRSRPVVLYYD